MSDLPVPPLPQKGPADSPEDHIDITPFDADEYSSDEDTGGQSSTAAADNWEEYVSSEDDCQEDQHHDTKDDADKEDDPMDTIPRPSAQDLIDLRPERQRRSREWLSFLDEVEHRYFGYELNGWHYEADDVRRCWSSREWSDYLNQIERRHFGETSWALGNAGLP